jgi:hypothetical protein
MVETKITGDRRRQIYSLLADGLSQTSIALELGISRQRVGQILCPEQTNLANARRHRRVHNPRPKLTTEQQSEFGKLGAAARWKHKRKLPERAGGR